MASQAYYDWKADGSPKRFSRPITAIADRLQEHGYTVYQQGNQAHLTHVPPEDHTFFSATGWPGKSPYPYCNAMDIMPPDAGQKSKLTGERLPSLQQLSAQLFKDKQAKHPGVAFLKYMNSEPAGDNTGPCYHDSWTPDHSRINSTDRGHIHVSGRSDSVTSTLSDDYDLVARVTGDDMAAVDLTDAAAEKVANAVVSKVLGSSGPNLGQDVETLETFPAKFAEILAAVQASGTPTVDVEALADAIVSRLPAGSLTKQDVADVLNTASFTA
jgi:hypothetical protein